MGSKWQNVDAGPRQVKDLSKPLTLFGVPDAAGTADLFDLLDGQ